MITIQYSYEKDLENYIKSYINHKYPDYGQGKLKIGSLVAAINEVNFDSEEINKEAVIAKELKKFTHINKTYLEIHENALSEAWQLREKEYIERLSKYFNVPNDIEATCYLTTVGMAPYNYKEKYFYTMMTSSLSRQLTTIAHEYMHLVLRNNFDDYLRNRGVDRQSILEINEALTVLLNYEFSDLFIVPDHNNKPSIEDLKSMVINMWQDKKNFDEILDKLIESRNST